MPTLWSHLYSIPADNAHLGVGCWELGVGQLHARSDTCGIKRTDARAMFCVCRGLGRQASLMWFNILGFWAVGFTTGYTLTFRFHWGLPGVWWGILSGVITTGQHLSGAGLLMSEAMCNATAWTGLLCHLYMAKQWQSAPLSTAYQAGTTNKTNLELLGAAHQCKEGREQQSRE